MYVYMQVPLSTKQTTQITFLKHLFLASYDIDCLSLNDIAQKLSFKEMFSLETGIVLGSSYDYPTILA